MKSLKRAITSLMNVAMEDEQTDGKTRIEREHVWYARIADFEELKRATEMIKQDQWQIRCPKTSMNLAKGNLRVRKNVYHDNRVEYVLTLKIFKSGDDRLESNLEATEDSFEVFRMLSEHGMIKHRYIFPVEGTETKFEIDVFLKPDGTYHNICKIDYEVDDMHATIPQFPISLHDVIKEDQNVDTATRATITGYYDQYFITRPGLTQGEQAAPKPQS